MKKNVLLVSSILYLFTIAHCPFMFACQKGLFIGTIQFPTVVASIPTLGAIYCAGAQIKYDINETSKKIVFSLPEDKRRVHFDLIITKEIDYEKFERLTPDAVQNTIKYLKVKANQPYKFYSLDLVKNSHNYPSSIQTRNTTDDDFDDDDDDQINSDKKTNPGQTTIHAWKIKELQHCLVDGRTPDDAIIICFEPNYVETVCGGSTVELPKIIIKDTILELAGSQAKLDDISAKVALASLDSNALHAKTQEQVNLPRPRTRLVITT